MPNRYVVVNPKKIFAVISISAHLGFYERCNIVRIFVFSFRCIRIPERTEGKRRPVQTHAYIIVRLKERKQQNTKPIEWVLFSKYVNKFADKHRKENKAK